MLDVAIVSIYILSVLIIGIRYSRGLKSMNDFSSVNKNFSGPVIMATISATYIGAESVFGIAEKAFSVGIIFFFALLGISVSKCFLASSIVPRVAHFSSALSVGDIMQRDYGTVGRVTAGISGAILSIGYVGAQIAACAALFLHFFDVPQTFGIVIGCGIVVVYSAFGGFKAVTFTDVLQFAVLIVAVPLVCNIELSQVGGYAKLFDAIPKTHFIPAKEIIYEHIAWLVVFMVPFLDPAVMQRMLMDKDSKKVANAWRLSALIDICFYILICTIGLVALVKNPSIQPNMAFTHILGNLPRGIAGIAIVGILAVIMSTADSYLNVASISLVHDVIKPLTKKKISDKLELRLAQVLTIVLGLSAIYAALKFPSMLDLIIHFLTLLWAPLVVAPLYASIFGLKAGVRSFIIAGICGLATQFIWPLLTGTKSEIVITMMSPAGSALGLLISHFVFQKRLPALDIKNLNPLRFKFPKFSWPRHLMAKIIRASSNRVNSFGASYSLFGLFAVLNFMIPYFMWSSSSASDLSLHLAMRFIAASLCFLLLMNDYWPHYLKKYLPVYWYFTLFYCLPFFSTFMLFNNNYSIFWVYNVVLALFLLGVLIDWLSFIVLLLCGVVCGYVLHFIVGGRGDVHLDPDTIYLAIYMYVFTILISVFFSRKNERIALEKMGVLKALSASIAHEMRTPLATISIGAENISKYFPIYAEAYEMARAAGLPVKAIPPNARELLEQVPKNIENVSKNTQSMIDMLLMRVKEISNSTPKDNRILSCVSEAIDKYPFSIHEKKKIILTQDRDFSFLGDKELFIHVIFNLIKNSLSQISPDDKGKIQIWTERAKDCHTLHFLDNGPGIPHNLLPKVFDRFVTGTEYGTGMGLAYCKMVMKGFGGDIFCKSPKNKGTEFVMSFPVRDIEQH